MPTKHERVPILVAAAQLPKVLATVVRLLEATLIRIGNDEYPRHNQSFGLMTLRDLHADIDGTRMRFEFTGKHGKRHAVELGDRRLARFVKQCRDIPGQELFQYVDNDGQRHAIASANVNEYLRDLTGQHFTAKDFRTWAGTVLADKALGDTGVADDDTQARHNIVAAVEEVAKRLGDTPAICRKCYIHPAVVDAYLSGAAIDVLAMRAR